MNVPIIATKITVIATPIITSILLFSNLDYSSIGTWFTSLFSDQSKYIDEDLSVEPTGTQENIYSLKTSVKSDDVFLVVSLKTSSTTLPKNKLSVKGVNSYVCNTSLTNNPQTPDSNCQIYQLNKTSALLPQINTNLLHNQLIPQRNKAELIDNTYHILKISADLYNTIKTTTLTDQTIHLLSKDSLNTPNIESFGSFNVLFPLNKENNEPLKTNLSLFSVSDVGPSQISAINETSQFMCKFTDPNDAIPFACSVFAKNTPLLTNSLSTLQNWSDFTTLGASSTIKAGHFVVLSATNKPFSHKDLKNKALEVFDKKDENPFTYTSDKKLLTLNFDQVLFGPTTSDKGALMPSEKSSKTFIVKKETTTTENLLTNLVNTDSSKNYRCKYALANKLVNYDDSCSLIHIEHKKDAILTADLISAANTKGSQNNLTENKYFKLTLNHEVLYNLSFPTDKKEELKISLVPNEQNTTSDNSQKEFASLTIQHELLNSKIVGKPSLAYAFKTSISVINDNKEEKEDNGYECEFSASTKVGCDIYGSFASQTLKANKYKLIEDAQKISKWDATADFFGAKNLIKFEHPFIEAYDLSKRPKFKYQKIYTDKAILNRSKSITFELVAYYGGEPGKDAFIYELNK